MGKNKEINSRKINSRRNLKSKKRRNASVNRIKKKNSNKYTKKKINVKRRGIKYYSSGGSNVDESLEVGQRIPVTTQKPDYLRVGEAGGLSLELADDSLETKWTPKRVPKREPLYVFDRKNAERVCGVGKCGQRFYQRNMRLIAPHYGEKIDGIKYNIKQRSELEDRGDSKLFQLICDIEHGSLLGRTTLLETVEIQYKLYTPLIEGRIQKGGYIYLRSINMKQYRIRPRRSAHFHAFDVRHIEDIAMQIFCSEVAWLLHNNKIQIYWDILVDISRPESEGYYERFSFKKRDNDYEIFIPKSDMVNDNIMVVNVSRFITRCQGLSIDMGPY